MERGNLHKHVNRVVVCGLMVAISAILGSWLSIPLFTTGAYSLKLSLAMVPVIFVSVAFGPVYGGLVAVSADFIQCLLAGLGAYNPLLAIPVAVMGVAPGLFFVKNKVVHPALLLLGVFIGQALGSVLLNSFFISISYGAPLLVLMTSRAINQCLHIPVLTVCVYVLIGVLNKAGVRLGCTQYKPKLLKPRL